GFKKVFSSKSLDKNPSIDDKENLYDNEELIPKIAKAKNKSEKDFSKLGKNSQQPSETYYCEIKDASFLLPDEAPLIDLKANDDTNEALCPYVNKLRYTDSKSNLPLKKIAEWFDSFNRNFYQRLIQ
ncbi:unnamed protein product, partial [Brachionus calyciflorus]